MTLLSQFTRGAIPRSPLPAGVEWLEVVPPPVPVLSLPPDGDLETGWCADAARQIGTTLLAGDGMTEVEVARLEAAVDEDVEVWTPSMALRSRYELIAALTDADDSIDTVDVVFTVDVASGLTVLLEWLATGRFSRAAFIDDDELIEPTGAVIRVGGALSVTFGGSRRATRICCYYDRLQLVDQLLAGTGRASP